MSSYTCSSASSSAPSTPGSSPTTGFAWLPPRGSTTSPTRPTPSPPRKDRVTITWRPKPVAPTPAPAPTPSKPPGRPVKSTKKVAPGGKKTGARKSGKVSTAPVVVPPPAAPTPKVTPIRAKVVAMNTPVVRSQYKLGVGNSAY